MKTIIKKFRYVIYFLAIFTVIDIFFIFKISQDNEDKYNNKLEQLKIQTDTNYRKAIDVVSQKNLTDYSKEETDNLTSLLAFFNDDVAYIPANMDTLKDEDINKVRESYPAGKWLYKYSYAVESYNNFLTEKQTNNISKAHDNLKLSLKYISKIPDDYIAILPSKIKENREIIKAEAIKAGVKLEQ